MTHPHTLTAVSRRLIDQAADDVRQLTSPIHMAVGRRLVTHPCLLDQLRAAVAPASASRGPGRTPPTSRPPINVDGSDALATIYVELAGWRVRLRLPSPPRETDWHKAILRALPDTMPTLTPDMATWLGTDVHEWWALAVRAAGWQTAELLKIR